MAFLKLLMNAGLIFAVATTLPVDDDSGNVSRTPAINYRLPDNAVPVHYNVKLMPYIVEGNFTFEGESSISIEIRRATQDVALHALNLTMNEASTSLIDSDDVARTPTAHLYNNVTQILILNFENELSPGLYILNMKFVGILHDDLQGFYRTWYEDEDGERVWLAVSHFEPTWARRAFPCWDEPALKATFDISVKHQRNYTALSNMPMEAQSENEDGTLWTRFATTPIMSTYLVAFVVVDYVCIPNADGTVNMWCRLQLAPQARYMQEIATMSVQLLTQYTNSTYRVPKMDHVAVPEFSSGAMENWGLIIYQENDFTYDNESDTTAHKHRIAVVAAHEMAHQWFGNVVSPLWWSYVWLNEGFASFFQNYILNEIFKDWRMMDLFVVQTQQNAFHTDISNKVKPITSEVNTPAEIDALFSTSSYEKAPVILRMLQHFITDEVFRKGLIIYLHTHQFGSATPDDLWSALQAALDESDVPHDDYRLKEVMDTWMEQRHYPVVHVTRDYETGDTILRQEHFQPHVKNENASKIDEDKWWIPLTFATQTNPDFNNTLPTHWLRPQDSNVTIHGIDSDDWVIVNVQQIGYYLVNYDDTNWRRIVDCLHSDDYKKIHGLNRAQLINDAYHLMMADKFNISLFLDIVSYLPRETDYVPWYPMFVVFRHMDDLFKLPASEALKPPILEILDGLIKSVGYEEIHGEDDYTKLKRVEALKWACTFGHSECKRMATAKLLEHLADPKTHKISPDLEEWTYCQGVTAANASVWNKVMDLYRKDPTRKSLLEYLTCSEDPDILVNFFNMSAENYSIIKDEHYGLIHDDIIHKHANNDLVLDYVLTNLEKLTSRDGNIKDTLHGLIYSVYSKQQFDKILEFVRSNYEDEKILKYLEEVETQRIAYMLDKYTTLQRILE